MNAQLGFDPAAPPGLAASSRINGWRAVVEVLRSPLRLLSDDLVTTVFPANCQCCDAPLLRAGVVPVCDPCLSRVTPSTYFACTCCGDAINLDLDLEDARFAGMLAQGFLCRECRLAPPAFTRAVAFAPYDAELRTLIGLLKFHRVRSVARLLGPQMAEAILHLEPHAASNLTVIAVPLFKDRERQRGYNQSVLLANHALRHLRTLRPAWNLTPSHAALVRQKSTASSFELSRQGRRRNLAGAFRVTHDVAGHEVLLLDDILTSGATARECARVLVRAGATKVWVATLARAQKQFIQRQHEDPGELVATWDLPVQSFSN